MTAKQQSFTDQALPNAFSCPSPLGSGEVSIRIVIDKKGNVSEAKALSGPENLVRAAETCARTWKFANPPSAPAMKTVILRYESRDCPAATSDYGDLQFSWGLRDRTNLVLAYVEGEQPPPPLYPDEERKAGKVGGMVLSVSLNADGTVSDARVRQGLSPVLDKEVMDRLHSLKFKLVQGVSETQLKDLTLQIIFHAKCTTETVSNVN